MTLIGFAFKIAAAPFHLWAPDAYQGAPIPSAAFIASGSKVASFVVLGKIVLVGFGPVHGSAGMARDGCGLVAGLLAVLAALSILIGNLVALAQTNVRRLLAYSAVAHAGYTLLGLVAGSRDGFSATLFTRLFTQSRSSVRSESSRWCAAKLVATILKIFRTGRRAPLLAGCMAVFMLSLAGIPPLAGFFGKFYLFSAALRAGGNYGLLWLVALALFGSFCLALLLPDRA